MIYSADGTGHSFVQVMEASYNGWFVKLGNGLLSIIRVESIFIIEFGEKRFKGSQYLYGFLKIGQIRDLFSLHRLKCYMRQ